MFSFIILVSISQAQTDQHERWENGVSNSWTLPQAPKVELDELKSRWKLIEEELKSTTNEYAGTYCIGGDMRGSIVRWAPKSGFVYVYTYEWLDLIGFSYGKVIINPSEITFTFERGQQFKNEFGDTITIPQHWIPARWKRNNYLIPTDDIAEFGNYVAGFGKYNDFNGPCCEFTPFFVDTAKSGSQESERPIVPSEYEHLIKQPIETTIKSVGRKKLVKNYGSEGELYSNLHLKASLLPVQINAGKKQGVKRGLLFHLVDAPIGQYLKIIRVGLAFSEGVIVRDIDENGERCFDLETGESKQCPPVLAGTKVTTSPL
ncbi:MAG: hypothetical protein AUG51_08595 [Acidobacteria bacterium 13_1_20CM_3_53_8]|nr:MAG: hypothetical protein AUG51_08595 [Acidobacteria bacterium 13_1_20CM_3_53_8]